MRATLKERGILLHLCWKEFLRNLFIVFSTIKTHFSVILINWAEQRVLSIIYSGTEKQFFRDSWSLHKQNKNVWYTCVQIKLYLRCSQNNLFCRFYSRCEKVWGMNAYCLCKKIAVFENEMGKVGNNSNSSFVTQGLLHVCLTLCINF